MPTAVATDCTTRIVQLQVRVTKLKALIRAARRELVEKAAELKSLEAESLGSTGVGAIHGHRPPSS